MTLDVIALTRKLVDIESVTGHEEPLSELLTALLTKAGFEVTLQPLQGQKRANIYAQVKGAVPQVLLTTHFDTVPPFFKSTLSDDGEWLLGRGVCDAKGIAAAMICAAMKIKESQSETPALLFVVGEETTSDGAKWAAKQMKQRFAAVINGEPTEMKLASSMKGVLVFELSAEGRAGHSAYPESGYSALHQLILDSAKILNFDWPRSEIFGDTTVNIGVLEGGVATNVFAAHAHLKGVMRLSCSTAEALANLSTLIHPKTTLKVLSRAEPRVLKTAPGFETAPVSFGCDIPHLEALGPALLFGPGSILDAHTDHERVRVKDLHEAVSRYEALCRTLAAS